MSLDVIIPRSISFVGCILIIAATESYKISRSFFIAQQWRRRCISSSISFNWHLVHIRWFFGVIGLLIPICDNRSSFTFHATQKNIFVLFVWYAGYSSGTFVASLTVTNCFVHYMELADKSDLNKPQVLDDSGHCQGYICSPLQYSKKRNCMAHIQASDRAIGTARILVTKSNSIGKCRNIPGITPEIPQPIYKITAIFSETWPLGKFKKKTFTHKASVESRTNFAYLDQGTVRLPRLCDEHATTRQMLVTVEVSSCRTSRHGFIIPKTVANIPSLSADCIEHKYRVGLSNARSLHMIYKEYSIAHTGTFFEVDYNKNCPDQCRAYTYNISMVNKDKLEVREYSASVGETLYPAYFHRGIRLTINPSKEPCEHIAKCVIAVRMYKPHYEIGIRRVVPPIMIMGIKKQSWYFYTKRLAFSNDIFHIKEPYILCVYYKHT